MTYLFRSNMTSLCTSAKILYCSQQLLLVCYETCCFCQFLINFPLSNKILHEKDKYILLTKCKMRKAGYRPSSLFAFFYGLRQRTLKKMILILVYFQALKRKPVICKSDGAFLFSRFLLPSQQRNQRKLFLSQKIFCERKLS